MNAPSEICPQCGAELPDPHSDEPCRRCLLEVGLESGTDFSLDDLAETLPFAGESSLRVTPPQRSAARIAGWEFRIREQPAVGEYRYIRFAWKAPQASGVMIELAADGQWPPADQPVRRYFAGRNLTAWQAIGIAPQRPSDWTVMTRDLWADFGDFTLTGFAPTAIDGPALFDRMELLRSLNTADRDK